MTECYNSLQKYCNWEIRRLYKYNLAKFKNIGKKITKTILKPKQK